MLLLFVFVSKTSTKRFEIFLQEKTHCFGCKFKSYGDRRRAILASLHFGSRSDLYFFSKEYSKHLLYYSALCARFAELHSSHTFCATYHLTFATKSIVEKENFWAHRNVSWDVSVFITVFICCDGICILIAEGRFKHA